MVAVTDLFTALVHGLRSADLSRAAKAMWKGPHRRLCLVRTWNKVDSSTFCHRYEKTGLPTALQQASLRVAMASSSEQCGLSGAWILKFKRRAQRELEAFAIWP